MAHKSKAASLTPDLLTSKTAPVQPAPRKQATDLSLAPVPGAGQPKSSETAAPAPTAMPALAPTPPPAKAKGKSKNVDPAPVPPQRSEEPVAEKAQIAAQTAPPPTNPPAPDRSAEAKLAEAVSPAVTASESDGKVAVADTGAHEDVHSDYRIRIPVPLDPSEHLELTLAAARSGRSCQEIIVEALFRYLEDIAGPSNRSAAPGPDAQP